MIELMSRHSNGRRSPSSGAWGLGSWVCVAAGCAPAAGLPAHAFLTSSEAQSTVVVEAPDCKGCKPAPRTFYVVTPEQLKRVRGASGLVYLGTEGEHHFFRAWNKLLEPPEVDHVAVATASCDIKQPGTFEEERIRSKYRLLDVSTGCAVR
jgi:hypothetical protein